jgi:uncharacterized protein YggE
MNDIFKIITILLLSVFVSFFGLGVLNFSSGFKNQITVVGTASKDISNQIAEFSVTFTSENADKANAENSNNEKVKKFLEEIRNFGISDSDVITEYLNVYQKQEERWIENEAQNKFVYTDWVFSQTIRVKIRDISKVNDFTNLASRNATSNIYGPNFSVDTQNIDESEVYNLAFENAKKKAENIANQSGRTLGKAMYITESSVPSNPFPIFARGLGGGAQTSAEVPSGSSSVTKTLNVVFELR